MTVRDRCAQNGKPATAIDWEVATMTKFIIDKIPWDFDASVPFMWQPANPGLGLFCNTFTFIAAPFERSDKPENARELHQLRDLFVCVEDPVGGGTGLGNAETFALGAFPERGLTAENSFL
jgi:hypothetical protein